MIGVLLLNIGTPALPTRKAVKAYLRQFLSDPAVVDLPAWQRWLLLNLFILPFRPKRSAEAYQQIWTSAGSPLMVYSRQLQTALTQALGSDYRVALGMRYGEPSIAKSLATLSDCDQLVAFPLFPQYASAASGSALAETKALVKKKSIPTFYGSAFFEDLDYLQSLVAVIKENLQFAPDYFLFSFHGIPERQLKYLDASGQNYREQCYLTAEKTAQLLALSSEKYVVAFQSRLGRARWLMPATTQTLVDLSARGVKNIAIVCPSFVVDCLETLEEIGIRAQKQWKQLGGEKFQLIPALNSHPEWIKTLVKLIKKTLLEKSNCG